MEYFLAIKKNEVCDILLSKIQVTEQHVWDGLTDIKGTSIYIYIYISATGKDFSNSIYGSLKGK